MSWRRGFKNLPERFQPSFFIYKRPVTKSSLAGAFRVSVFLRLVIRSLVSHIAHPSGHSRRHSFVFLFRNFSYHGFGGQKD